jgi:hypothetical protein
MKSLKLLCSANDCTSSAKHERTIKDIDTDKTYRIYLCRDHKNEFDFHNEEFIGGSNG